MKTLAIGLMSGTSLDGLDICLAEFEKKDKWDFQILKAETLPYSTDWENKLRNSIHFSVKIFWNCILTTAFIWDKKLKNL
jgi:anhydro-N-acetylmuramic acid kinase